MLLGELVAVRRMEFEYVVCGGRFSCAMKRESAYFSLMYMLFRLERRVVAAWVPNFQLRHTELVVEHDWILSRTRF